MSNFIMNFLNNLTPPPACLLCGADSHQAALCRPCIDKLPWLTAIRCPQCALPTLDGKPCGQCIKSPPAFDSTLAVFQYRDTIAQLVSAAKFGGHWSILPALAELVISAAEQSKPPDFLIPLPLHAHRLKERGYNQALEIARPIAQHLKLPLLSHLLQRTRDTEHQTRLSEKARHRNMRKAFEIDADLAGAHVGIIDDVMTTGASLNAAARALKQAGAARVDCWVLARTL